ncbi:MAG: hypothetical protein ABI395_07260 [Sphingobium sp.]
MMAVPAGEEPAQRERLINIDARRCANFAVQSFLNPRIGHFASGFVMTDFASGDDHPDKPYSFSIA